VDKEEIDRLLLNVLYRDLRSRRGNLILKDKWERDNPRFITVTRHARAIGLLTITLVLMVMVVYVCYFAIEVDEPIELLWFWSLFVWFLLDFFIFSTLEVLYIEVYTPRCFSGSTDIIRSILFEIWCGKNRGSPSHGNTFNSNDLTRFNSLNFIFSSFRISGWYKEFDIAKKISMLSSHMPPLLVLEGFLSKYGEVKVTTNYESIFAGVEIFFASAFVWYMEKISPSIRRSIDEFLIIVCCLSVTVVYFSLLEAFGSQYLIPAAVFSLTIATIIFCRLVLLSFRKIIPDPEEQQTAPAPMHFDAMLDHILNDDSSSSAHNPYDVSEDSVEGGMIDTSLRLIDGLIGPEGTHARMTYALNASKRASLGSAFFMDPQDALDIIDDAIGADTTEARIAEHLSWRKNAREKKLAGVGGSLTSEIWQNSFQAYNSAALTDSSDQIIRNMPLIDRRSANSKSNRASPREDSHNVSL